MASIQNTMNEFKIQLERGRIQEGYRELMECIMDLRVHLKNKYPDHFVSGNVYQGYMDMTYFAFTPESLKRLGLKIAIVFVYETFRFEVWLGGQNRRLGGKYWKLLKERKWDKYEVPNSPEGLDYIALGVLLDEPDFSNREALKREVENGTLMFVKEVEDFLSQNAL